MKKSFVIVLVLVLTGFGILAVQAQDAQTPAEICAAASVSGTPGKIYDAPEQVLEKGVNYQAIFCTESGPIYIDLFEDYAPVTVNSFVFLAQEGYYDNTTFHRVIADFMAQGGDPTATGTGGPGYQFEDEFVGFLTFDNPGLLAMANAGAGTNGSQFFITTAPTTHLDFNHTIFGKVLEGQENVVNLKIRDPQADADTDGSRLDTIVIITDPVSVETTYEPAAPLSQDEVEAAFGDLVNRLNARYGLPDDMGLEDEVVAQTTDEAVAAAAETIQSDYADYLARYNHEYSISGSIINTACDTEIPFSSIHYTLAAYGSVDAAAGAMADEFAAQFPLENGFSAVADSENLPNPLFTAEVDTCGGQYTHALTQWQRGHFVATLEAVVSPDNVEVADLLISQLVGLQIFEYLVGDVLRGELG